MIFKLCYNQIYQLKTTFVLMIAISAVTLAISPSWLPILAELVSMLTLKDWLIKVCSAISYFVKYLVCTLLLAISTISYRNLASFERPSAWFIFFTDFGTFLVRDVTNIEKTKKGLFQRGIWLIVIRFQVQEWSPNLLVIITFYVTPYSNVFFLNLWYERVKEWT